MQVRCGGCFEFYDNQYELCPHCGYYDGTMPQEPYHLPAGKVLGERYVLGNVVGFGGFGITYKAWDKTLETVVAIKEYYPSGIVNRAIGSSNIILFSGQKKKEFEFGLERFILEAQNMAKFNAHKNIVNVFAYFEENNTAYIVMEFLYGCTLGEKMEEHQGKMDLDKSINIILSVCNALSEIHSHEIIHRDISPDNIFLCSDGTIKLIDFGAARFSQKAESQYTIILKPGFAPPEQYEKVSNQGPWTDIYATGATLYYIITGEKPEESTNRKVKDNIKEPIEINSDIPQYISDAILKAMAIEPHMRFPAIDEFVAVIKKEKKVKSLKKEKAIRRTKRFCGILVLVAVLAGLAAVFSLNVDKKNEKVNLKPAEITLWYINDRSDALQQVYEGFASEFCSEYKDVKVDLVGISTNEYREKLADAKKSEDKPNIFISTDMDGADLQNTVDLSSVVMPENMSKMYFLLSLLKTTEQNNCYFLNAYQVYFPSLNQIPTGFNVPVIYVNSSIVDFDEDSINDLDKILSVLGNGKKFLVNENMKEAFQTVFADNLTAESASLIQYGSVDDFVNGNIPFYFSSTYEFFEIRSMPSKKTGIPKIVSINVSNLPCEWSTVWSVNNSNKNENAASVRFIEFMLSDNAQSRLFGKNGTEKALPLNADSLATISGVFSELDFIIDLVKKCTF